MCSDYIKATYGKVVANFTDVWYRADIIVISYAMIRYKLCCYDMLAFRAVEFKIRTGTCLGIGVYLVELVFFFAASNLK